MARSGMFFDRFVAMSDVRKAGPSQDQQRLWIARAKTELAAGTPVEDAAIIVKRMVASWQNVEENCAVKN